MCREIVFALLIAIMATSVVSAHYCTNPQKPTGAGSIGVVNIATDEAEFTKRNGGFITLTDGAGITVDLFIHAQEKHNFALPAGALNSGPGDSQCDGKGIDNALVCFGVDE